MLTKNGIHTLIEVVIANPIQADLLFWSCAIQGFDASDVAQAKERSFCNWHPTNQFLPLAIELFGCLHKHANVFLHDCANAIWNLKRPEGLHLSTLVTFLHKKISITLQKMQASSILNRVITVGLATFQFPPLQDTTPITTADLLQAINFWHINMADLL